MKGDYSGFGGSGGSGSAGSGAGASVKNCSQKVSIESPIMIRRPVVQGFL